VRAAADAGLPVSVIPGPGAIETALVASGISAEAGYVFLGFLPRKAAERARALEALQGEARPAVLFESPKRLPALLADLAALEPGRAVAVCREMTKIHEEVVRGTAAEVAARFPAPPKGEIAVVVGPAPSRGAAAGDLPAAMARLLDAGLTPGQAASAAAALGLARRNAAYEAALAAAESRRSR
jgi:16S rRNA (cytidine1402-2'-O)-methyltransferase